MRRFILAWTTLGAALTLLAGCGAKGTLKPNVPPDTRIFVQGPVDPVNHIVQLFWSGTDVDGTITGYELRFLNPNAPADTCWMWVPADSTNGWFNVYSPDGFAAPVFEVRAIDGSGEQPPAVTAACARTLSDTLPGDSARFAPHYGTRDPSPARQSFKFTNQAPTVTLRNRHRMADTTYGAVTLEWEWTDPSAANGSLTNFFIWLDGNEGNKIEVAGNKNLVRSFTIPTEHFLLGGPRETGPRQMFIQAVNDGGMLSTIDSTRWIVRSPGAGGRRPNTGRLLLIDDQPSTYSENLRADTLHYNTVTRNLLPGQWSLLRVDAISPLNGLSAIFRSNADMLQTFKQFDAVVWYIGGSTQDGAPLSTLQAYQAYQGAIGSYLESGGNLYLEGLNLIDTPGSVGPLRSDFVKTYLGSDFLFRYVKVGTSDSTADWSTSSAHRMQTAGGDFLQFNGILKWGIRCFGVRDASYGLVWAPPLPIRSLYPYDLLKIPVPVAVSVPQPSGGRCVVVTFPLEKTLLSTSYPNAPRFLAQVFQQLGLTTP